MKKLMCFMLIAVTSIVFPQKSMGVRIGGPTQSYYLNVFKFGAIQPMVGMDYWGGSFNYELDEKYTETDYGETYSSEDHLSAKGSLHLFMPRLGIKYYRSTTKNIKSYFLAEGFIVIPIVNFESTSNGKKEELDEDEKKQIQDALDLIGLTFGFGNEYYFSDQFSIGAEFGLNVVLWNFSDEYSDEYHSNYSDYSWEESSKLEVKAGLGGGFARMTINFHY